MKALDEVVDEMQLNSEVNCHYREEHADALHYLIDYRLKREVVMKRVQACEDRETRLQEEIARYQEAVKNCEEAEN